MAAAGQARGSQTRIYLKLNEDIVADVSRRRRCRSEMGGVRRVCGRRQLLGTNEHEVVSQVQGGSKFRCG